MTASPEYTEYVLELLAPIGRATTSRFFGGVGILSGAVQFAMIMGNCLYFVVDDSSRPKYVAAGMTPFSYRTKKGRVQVRRYYEVPEDILTDPDQLRAWASESIRVAGVPRKAGKTYDRKRPRRRAG